MSQFKALTIVLAIALPTAGLSAELVRNIEGPETVEISKTDREALLAAPRKSMGGQLSAELTEAINAGTVAKVTVDRYIERFTGAAADDVGRDVVTTYQGWIRYTPVARTDSRLFRPMVLCISQDIEISWDHCQDESWLQFQSANMLSPIRLNGDLEDDDVTQIFALIDDAALISKNSGQPLTSDGISHVTEIPNPDYSVIVAVRYSKEDCKTEFVYLTRTTDSVGRSVFEISENQGPWAQE